MVTLAGLIGFRGAARILLEDRRSATSRHGSTTSGGTTLLGPMPFALVLFFVMLVVGGVVLHRTAFGRKVYVIGNNAEVARFSGDRRRAGQDRAVLASGLVAGIAGVLFAARLGSVRANIGEGFELDIITMVLLGGVSIFGGSGTMLGVALAICIVLNLRNGLGLANVEANTQTGVIGVLLIVSVLAGTCRPAAPRAPRGAGGGDVEPRTRQLVGTATVAARPTDRRRSTRTT